ncbi:DUF3734 domain-containing protein, partial [Burkholderia sp. AU4i]|uniref:DUF3734 domain-containing protein n=1 Tax=Burkholderia sp. AU4i TaxID=1335308 RepID=UPI0015CFE86C
SVAGLWSTKGSAKTRSNQEVVELIENYFGGRPQAIVGSRSSNTGKTQRNQEEAEWGCGTTMHVVQLKMPRFDGDDYAKDIDFSADGVQTRWDAGFRAARSVLGAAPWRHPVDPIEGIAVHEVAAPTE